MANEFTTQEEMEHVLSEAGIDSFGEDEDGSDVGTHIESCMRWAKNTTKFWLSRRYEDSALSGNSWISEANAILACHELCRRRGNPIPASLQAWYIEKLEEFKMIKAGNADVPDAAARYTKGIPGMSNLTVDLTRGIAKLRVQDRISTGRVGSELQRDEDVNHDGRIDD